MKLSQLFESAPTKAGCIPYVMINGKPSMAFMISSDADYGGPDPMIAKGHIDDGEDAKTAGIREAEEELGLKKSNIIDSTLILGWQGKLKGQINDYEFAVFTCEVKDKNDFNTPHYETKEVVWLTKEEFDKVGRHSQRHIVSAVAAKIGK